MISEQQMKKNWSDIKSGMRNLWSGLADEESDLYRWNIFDLTSLIETRSGESKRSIITKLDQLLNSFENPTDRGESPDVTSFKRSPRPSLEARRP